MVAALKILRTIPPYNTVAGKHDFGGLSCYRF